MKKINKKLCILLAILTLTSIFNVNITTFAQTIEDPYSNYIDDPYIEVTNDYIQGLADRLTKFKPSGDVAVDYLSQEILLHRALLFASYNVEQFTKNPELLDITDDITDYYLGELKELKELLPNVIKEIKSKNLKNDDTTYMNDYKGIIDNMNKELSSINSKESAEVIYLKQSLAILQAMYSLSQNSLKYSKGTLTKEISESIVKDTPTYISKLQELQKNLK